MTAIRAPLFSVVITTYNRGELLADAIKSVLMQQGAPSFEVIAVDNNSTDNTREVITALQRSFGEQLRYVFEAKQGASNGRNAGIAASRGEFVAFTDDDVRADQNWLATIKREFDANPSTAFVGGRVYPRWPAAVPEWLTSDHWSPLALVDYGAEAFAVDMRRPVCLVSANLAVRKSALNEFGGFDPFQQHLDGAVAATEDHELQLRMIRGDHPGRYSPEVLMRADVQLHRMHKAYHRKWHAQHGRAVTRLLQANEAFDSQMLPTPAARSVRQLFSVPLWVYRQFLSSAMSALGDLIRGQESRAFWHECQAREALGMFRGYRERSTRVTAGRGHGK
ncbi:MAG: glycosyltransferase family 2 protein [Gemmatimonadaceae bacterium]